jgi:hypothetical protein
MSPSRRPSTRAASVIVVLGLGAALAAGPVVRAQSKGKAKATPAPAAAVPTVSVGGIRIVAPGVGEEGTEIRAFNESPGTSLALFVRVGGGAGIVEIDEDKSALNALTDDTGANLLEEARFGPFPKVTKDGSTGMVEVETRARPSAGATAITAEGTVVFTSSSGTKTQKVSNVKLEAGKTFKVGTSVVTIGDVAVDGEYGTLTLKLPRSALLTIRELRFKDSKNQPIPVDRMGSGWMGDDAEISFRLPAAVKAANLELDVWQNLKEQSAAFTIKVGLSLR